MPARTSAVASHITSADGTVLPDVATQTSDAPWAAWQARGATHDRSVGRRLRFAAAPVLVAVALVLYLLLTR